VGVVALVAVLALVGLVLIVRRPAGDDEVTSSAAATSTTAEAQPTSSEATPPPASSSTEAAATSSSTVTTSSITSTTANAGSGEAPEDVTVLRPPKLAPERRDPLQPGEVIATNGVGPYLIGETYENLKAVPGITWSTEYTGTTGDFTCTVGAVRLTTGPLFALVIGDRVATVVVDSTGYLTKSGIGVGSTADELHSAYPDLAQIRNGTESEEAWLFEPSDPEEQNYVVGFFLRNDAVVEIRSGIRRYVSDVEDFCGFYLVGE